MADYRALQADLLPHRVRARARSEPDRTLIEETRTGRRLTYSAFDEGISGWANGLASLGVGQGDTIATLFPVSATALQVWLGAAWLRALEVPINNEYLGSMLSNLLNRSKARVLVIAADYVERVAAVADDLTFLKTVVVADGPLPAGLPLRAISTAECCAAPSRELEGPAHFDPLGIVFTSGTTGPAKGVIVPWAQLAGAVKANFPNDDPDDYADGAIYCPWPPYNLLGKGALDIAVRQGLRLILRPRFSQRAFWADVHAYRCTHATVPFVGPWLLREAEKEGDSSNPLRRVAMVPVMSEFKTFADRFGVRISTAYAATEAGYVIGTDTPTIAASCGKVLSGYEARVVDEHDELVAPGEVASVNVV